MTAFEHVTALLSFVYALALTHLLARVAELIVACERVKFSGLLALGMVNAVLLVFVNWTFVQSRTGILRPRPFSSFLPFLSTWSAHWSDPRCQMRARSIWRIFSGAFIVCLVLALLANLDFLK